MKHSGSYRSTFLFIYKVDWQLIASANVILIVAHSCAIFRKVHRRTTYVFFSLRVQINCPLRTILTPPFGTGKPTRFLQMLRGVSPHPPAYAGLSELFRVLESTIHYRGAAVVNDSAAAALNNQNSDELKLSSLRFSQSDPFRIAGGRR